MSDPTTPSQDNGSNGGRPLTLDAFENAAAYPILTDEITSYDRSDTAASSRTGSSNIGRLVDGAIRDVLAWRPREDDPKGFVSALGQAFELYEVEGHTEWKWVQRSYAIDAELGAVTGAQASIYARARSFLDQAMPLLNGLKPLRPDFDAEDTEAARAIASSSLTELVNELGQEGGPRISRVDQLFDLLLGRFDNPAKPETVRGQLGMLKQRFGLSRGFVKTISEEENLTNYLILVDGVRGLHLTWKTQRTFFDRTGNDVYLGTQAVLLSRNLGVVAESVREVNMALDSVFIGAAERQVTVLPLPGDSKIFVGELLAWVEEFATDEGPRLVREGGKDGVVGTFVHTADRLRYLTEKAAEASKKGKTSVEGFHTPRVRRAIHDLACQLADTVRLSRQLRANAPDIEGAEETRRDDAIVTVTAKGENLAHSALARIVHVSDPKRAYFGDIDAKSDHRVIARFDLRGEAGTDEWYLYLADEFDTDAKSPKFTINMSTDDGDGDSGAGPHTPTPPPEIRDATFTEGGKLTITGANLTGAKAVSLTQLSQKSPNSPQQTLKLFSEDVSEQGAKVIAQLPPADQHVPTEGERSIFITVIRKDGQGNWSGFVKTVSAGTKEWKPVNLLAWQPAK